MSVTSQQQKVRFGYSQQLPQTNAGIIETNDGAWKVVLGLA